MVEALIPYITAPDGVFGPLVWVGLFVGLWRSLAYARRKDFDEALFRSYLAWTLAIAVLTSHVVSVVFEFPEQLAKDPWLLLKFWMGLSGLGGLLGIFVGGVFYLRVIAARRPEGKQPVLPFSDAAVFGLLLGWSIIRLACSLVHDHPGRLVPKDTFMAIGPWADGSWRHDLGLLELLFTLGLMSVVYAAKWDRWAPGRLTGLVLTAFAPFRFLVDYLRLDQAVERVLGLTPTQWAMVAVLLGGLWLLGWRKPRDSDLQYAKQSERGRPPEAPPISSGP